MTSQIIEDVKNRLKEAYKPREIYLFGSFAWGSPDPQSDLDLLIVVAASDEKPHKRARIGIESLKGLKIAKDIIVYTSDEFERLSADVSTLCYKIKKEGIRLYAAA